jgi:hypothetical protein
MRHERRSIPTNSVLAEVWRVWADYWLTMGKFIPPITQERNMFSGGILIVVPLSSADIEPFLHQQMRNPRFTFQLRGDGLISEHDYYGTWTSFSADVKALPYAEEKPIGSM